MKEKEFRNMVGDPYLYNDCCGRYNNAIGVNFNEPDLGAKAVKIATSLAILVGVVVTSTYVYNRFIKK